MTKNLSRAFLIIAALCATALSTTAQFITNNGLQVSNSALLYTNGDWTNSSGSIIVNNGKILTTDNFQNDGTLDPTSNGGFELVYSTPHSFKPGGSINYLKISGPGLVQLTGNITIKDTLFLYLGSIKMQLTSDTLTLDEDAVVLTNPGLYVEGKVANMGSGNKIFPLGADGKSMPLTLYKMNATTATASITSRPAGATAGPGLDSLSALPYAWRVDEKITSDTAAYVELNFNAATAPVNSAVVARYDANNNRFVSMGARVATSQSSYGRVVSYTRGLDGIYTVAYGVPVNRAADSLALRAFYYATGGDETWKSKTGWITGPIESWQGLSFAGQAIVSLQLPDNGLNNSVPDQLVDLGALTQINLSNNELMAIPDFSVNAKITSLDVHNNRLTFESLEPNVNVAGLNYAPQRLGDPLDELIEVHQPYNFAFTVGGENTSYAWKRNGVVIEGATTPEYAIESIDRNNMGAYTLEATNTLFPGYTLTSATQNVLAYASVAGSLLLDNAAVNSGDVKILKVTTGAYEPADTVQLQSGAYNFEKIVLGDYVIVGFADTITYESALPTYYGNTIFWEEAEVVAVDDHISGLDISSSERPGASSGPGLISGYLEEDDAGRTKDVMATKRVGGAGVTARRVEDSGRGKEEIYTLVGYTFTDDEGNFALDELPNGEYLLNIQYPGYPMDPNSDIRLNVADALRSEIMVGATVENGKINVKRITVTNIYETKDYSIQLYPNPAVEYINLKFGQKSTNRTIVITDIAGRSLFNSTANDLESRIDISTVKRGIYLLQVQENGIAVKTVKVSIQ
jgi:hypothetical protein